MAVRKREVLVGLADACNTCDMSVNCRAASCTISPFPLDKTLNGNHRFPKDDPALAFIQRRPDYKIGHTDFIVDRYERPLCDTGC